MVFRATSTLATESHTANGLDVGHTYPRRACSRSLSPGNTRFGKVQVAHFLEADLQPWGAALTATLFASGDLPPSEQQHGSTAQADAAPACSTVARRQDAWQHLHTLKPLGDAVDAVLRASRMTLLEQLPCTPAEWQPAVIGSHAVNGELTLDFATAAACQGAMRDLHDVRSLVLDRHQRGGESDCEARRFARGLDLQLSHAALQDLVCTLNAVATMPALRSVQLDVSHAWVRDIVQQLAPALSRLSQLAALNLSHNAFGDNGALTLVLSLIHI